MEFKEIREWFSETRMLVCIDKTQYPLGGSDDHEPFCPKHLALKC